MGIVRCINDTLVAFGYAALPSERIEQIIGPPLRDGFAELIAQSDGDGRDAAACVRYYRDLYEDVATTGGTLLQPGIVEMLATVGRDATLAVATSKSLRFTEPILTALGIRHAFAVVMGPTPETDGESKSSTLRRAMDAFVHQTGLAINAADAFMVGDRYNDIEAAFACGIVPIGVTWGFGSERELRHAGARHIVRDPQELAPLVDRIAGAA